jgi:hypothetical protein
MPTADDERLERLGAALERMLHDRDRVKALRAAGNETLARRLIAALNRFEIATALVEARRPCTLRKDGGGRIRVPDDAHAAAPKWMARSPKEYAQVSADVDAWLAARTKGGA